MNESTCDFTYQNGRRCHNSSIMVHDDVHSCHIMGHCSEPSRYEEYVARMKQQFIESTLSIDACQIINNKKDGACFYRAVSKLMYDNHEIFDIDVDEYDEDMQSRVIQYELNDFIYENRTLIIKQCFQSLEDIVLETHSDNISTLEEYHELYGIFAGDNDYVITEKVLESGKVKKIKDSIPDRWGSTAEQIAFSLKYGIRTNVYLLQKFDTKTLKVKNVSKRAKDIRIRLYQSIDPEIEGIHANECELNIILEQNCGMGHYLYISA